MCEDLPPTQICIGLSASGASPGTNSLRSGHFQVQIHSIASTGSSAIYIAWLSSIIETMEAITIGSWSIITAGTSLSSKILSTTFKAFSRGPPQPLDPEEWNYAHRLESDDKQYIETWDIPLPQTGDTQNRKWERPIRPKSARCFRRIPRQPNYTKA